ncbi:MAG: septation protein A [Pseudomonadota bacterium]
MTDTTTQTSAADSKPIGAADSASAGETLGQGAKLLVDIGPVAAFMIVYNVWNSVQKPDKAAFDVTSQAYALAVAEASRSAIFVATGVFMVATLIAIAYSWIKEKRISPMLMVTGVIVAVFGGATLYFQNALFIKLKPTIINGLYAAVILGGLAVGYNVWRMLFQSAFVLPSKIWDTLAFRWGLWFVFLAILNEVVWRNFSEAFWANFKLLGVLPLTLIFTFANLPITQKYLGKTDEDLEAEKTNA